MTKGDKTYEDYMHEINLMNTDFPNAKFTISIDYNKLDDVLSLQRTIYVVITMNCHCYGNGNNAEVYKITSDEPISNRIVIKELIRRGFKLDCDHFFVEGFRKVNSSMFEIMTGS